MKNYKMKLEAKSPYNEMYQYTMSNNANTVMAVETIGGEYVCPAFLIAENHKGWWIELSTCFNYKPIQIFLSKANWQNVVEES